jgi:V/A-type H+/Na+-transporting ATPase subunit F
MSDIKVAAISTIAPIAAIGDRNSVLGFSALGVNVMTPAPDKVREAVIQAIKDEVIIIFITEKMAESVSDLIDSIAKRPYPTVVMIPDATGSKGLGLKKLNETIIRAVGSNITSKEDEREAD